VRYRLQLRIRRGPVRINLSRSGASVTVYPLWPLTRRVSWSSRTGKVTVDTPGPGSFVTERRVGLPVALVGLGVMAAVAVAAVAAGWLLWGGDLAAAAAAAVDDVAGLTGR
jgi:hypothetical protein